MSAADERATLVQAMQELGAPADFTDQLIGVITETSKSAVFMGLENGVRAGYDGAIMLLRQHEMLTAAAVLQGERERVLLGCAAALKEAKQDEGV